jgi:hypothetical protein
MGSLTRQLYLIIGVLVVTGQTIEVRLRTFSEMEYSKIVEIP